jgi:hypothetical protein
MEHSISEVQDYPAANTRGAKFRRRQTFSRLPDETLENIFLESILGSKDLCALALVSRRIRRLAQVSLYHQVSIPLLKKENICFHRTLSEHPELGSYVWGACFYGQGRENNKDYEREGFRAAQQLLELLPALRTFDMKSFECSDELNCLFDIPMSHLHYLSFFNDGTSRSLHEVTKAISFPQLKRLHIENAAATDDDGDEWTRQGTALDALAGTSSLKDLDLDWWSDSVVLDSSLLKVPHALERLSCFFVYSGRFTPRGTIEALKPLYSTLVFLDITYLDFMADLSGPVADFSSFVSLKSLAVDDSLCFETWSNNRPDNRCGFYSRLPSSLGKLHVSVLA